MATKKAATTGKTKTSAAKKAPAKKAVAKKPPAKKSPAKKIAAKTAKAKAPSKTSTATKSAAKKPAAKEPAAKKPATAEKIPVKSKLDQKFIDAQKKLLTDERVRYVQSEVTWRNEAVSLMESREPGDVQFDEESGEGDSLAVERERDLVLSSMAREAVEQIDAALARIEDGTYGVCTGSGKPIPKERLKAIPWASERVEFKVAGFRRR